LIDALASGRDGQFSSKAPKLEFDNIAWRCLEA
jgi:hypothetical protein